MQKIDSYLDRRKTNEVLPFPAYENAIHGQFLQSLVHAFRPTGVTESRSEKRRRRRRQEEEVKHLHAGRTEQVVSQMPA